MMNPLKEVRIGLGFTQYKVAYSTGLDRQSVLANEQGLYDKPSKKLLKYYHIDPDDYYFDQRYQNWRIAHRSLLRGLLKSPDQVLTPICLDHPLTIYRVWSGYTERGFATALCIHPYTITRFEKSIGKSLPRSLALALSQAGLSSTQIEFLSSTCRNKS